MIRRSPGAAIARCDCAPGTSSGQDRTPEVCWDVDSLSARKTIMPATNRLPLPFKLAYTAFMAVLIPVYWYYYGPTNFLYFCDVTLIITLIAVWIESPLLISMCAVGILLPQVYWVI